jgi:hypothetical protein
MDEKNKSPNVQKPIEDMPNQVKKNYANSD